MEIQLDKVQVGSECALWDGTKIKLLVLNQSRALVQIMAMTKTQITKKGKDGEDVLAEFDKPGQKISISPGTRVTLLRTPADIELDDFDISVPDDVDISVPEERTPRTKGVRGKPAAAAMKRQLNANKKIGKVVQWFIDNGPQSIKVMAKKFEITNGCALSYLFILNRDYGLGYTVENDIATVMLPKGVKNPFKVDKEVEIA